MKKLSALINEEEDPFGPGTDLITSLVAFLLLVLAVAALTYKKAEADSQAARMALNVAQANAQAVSNDRDATKKENAGLKAENERLKKRITAQPPVIPPPPDEKETSPLIPIQESNGKFASGSAELTSELKGYIHDIVVPKIEDTSERFGLDTIMVIGHTDGRPVGSPRSTLDEAAAHGIELQNSLTEMKPGSNVDLGMMRALAVIAELRNIKQREGRLRKIDTSTGFRAYSAGPFLSPLGAWASPEKTDDKSRRRIEIRFLREKKS